MSLVLFFLPLVVSATESCGTITGPKNFNLLVQNIEIITFPIVNCADPFGVTVDPPSPYTLYINNEVVENDQVLAVPQGKTNELRVIGTPYLSDYQTLLFRHEGDSFVYIEQNAPEAGLADYVDFAASYFATAGEIELYTAIIERYWDGDSLNDYFYNLDGSNREDEVTSGTVENRFWSFFNAANNSFPTEKPFIEVGTYTMLIREYELILSRKTIFEKFFALIVPTAYAATFPEPNTYTVTFTLTEATVEPLGASSVLFLPGIMGSRLYEESDACTKKVEEQERWPSRDDCEQLRISTNFLGHSSNDIYTLPNEDSVIGELYTLNIYKTFLRELSNWRRADIIADYRAIPYDWRLKLDDVLKTKLVDGKIIYDVSSGYQDSYLYQSLVELVDSSKSGKVSIVAHSNGGLVAKTLMYAMKVHNDPLLKKVDNVILVGVPQVGTPEAVVGILHGSNLGPGGAVMSQEIYRQLVNTMPSAHHLLPQIKYFETVETPVVVFEEGEITSSWRDIFGTEIHSQETLQRFLSKDSGRVVPTWTDLATPAVVDGYLFNYVEVIEEVLREWSPELGTKVYQIAGVGLDTPATVTYFTDQECVARNPFLLFKCVTYQPKLGYRVTHLLDGDGAVVSPSALVMAEDSNVERWWLSLDTFNKDSVVNRQHRDLLEVEEILTFIQTIINSNINITYEYLQRTDPGSSSVERLIFQLHSPLDMKLVTSGGEEISSSTDTLSGAIYRRYGELQYISAPSAERGLKLILIGEAQGSFSLDIESWKGEVVKEKIHYTAIPSSVTTKVFVDINGNLLNSKLAIDYEGDGKIDGLYDHKGELTLVKTDGKSSGGKSNSKLQSLPSEQELIAGVSSHTITMTNEQNYIAEMLNLLSELSRLLKLWAKII